LDAIVLDGNVRAMEGVACALVRAGSRMQVQADAVLSDHAHPIRLPVIGSASHTMAMRTARRALAGSIPDPSLGAAAFHRMGDMPEWARATKPLVQIGEIVFYAAAPRTLNAMAVG
jgi:spore germination cell wall hydrolase CwlJ-like protein